MLFPSVFLRESVVLCSQDRETTLQVHVGGTQLGTAGSTNLPPAPYISLYFGENREGKQYSRFSIGIIQPT